jgi:hypothetical protein
MRSLNERYLGRIGIYERRLRTLGMVFTAQCAPKHAYGDGTMATQDTCSELCEE